MSYPTNLTVLSMIRPININLFCVHLAGLDFCVYRNHLMAAMTPSADATQKYYHGDVQGAELPNYIDGLGSMEHRNANVMEFPLTYMTSCKR